MDIQRMIDELEKTGFKVCSYSGRCMYGAHCIGVDVDDWGTALKIGAVLREAFGILQVEALGDTMHWDNMGRGFILYWPSLKVTPELRIARDEDEDEDDI